MPCVGKDGPQSQLNEHCVFRIRFAPHAPWYCGGTHSGSTVYGSFAATSFTYCVADLKATLMTLFPV